MASGASTECMLIIGAVLELWYYCAYHDVSVRGEDMFHNYVAIVVSYHFETHTLLFPISLFRAHPPGPS